MEAADDFLHQPLLSLPAPGDDKSPSKNWHNQSLATKLHTDLFGFDFGLTVWSNPD